MSRLRYAILLLGILVTGSEGAAQGISFDAGITPAQGRIIVRTQYRHIAAEAAGSSVTTHMVPLVMAYGLKPGVTIMARNMYFHRTFSASDVRVNGLNDPYLLAKFRLYRKNTASWVLGVAPHIGLNLPIGAAGIGSDTWNPDLGLNISFRPRFFSVDLSASYRIQDITVKSAGGPPDGFSANMALSHIVPVNASGEKALAPVVELNYFRDVVFGEGREAGNPLLMVSPGCTFIASSFALEGLVQVPLYQASEAGVKQRYRFVAGLKFMF